MSYHWQMPPPWNRPPQRPATSQSISPHLQQIQQRNHERQALGSAAAAALSNVFNPHLQPPQPHSPYYHPANPAYPAYPAYTDYMDSSHQPHAYPDPYSPPPPLSALARAPASTPDQRQMIAYDDIQVQPKGKTCCDRWYKSDLAYQQHCKQHVKCPDCHDFYGIPAMIASHQAQAHGKNDNEKKKPDGIVPLNAPKLQTQEEIDAWIAARKRNWPSSQNVERKKREADERHARGELPLTAAKRRKIDKQNQKKPTHAVPGLVDYAATDEDEDGIMDLEADAVSSKDPTSMGKLPEHDTPKKPICKYFLRGKCRNTANCRFSHERPAKVYIPFPL
ncbi:hypothetical protein DM01DRAFT_1337644 [Hesseltinella vesiculosa]|uniref:C3H1-type domain-containing protein n=1 Tax=Hesseltinella vesiculosa TaxID=101127 RepID=A0A1X2GC48_9FUNG|nr:hypothetical protein DM01DRAFT_1337644 [Hesseltinella vesiculosa]